jgi:hypothetical protein
VSLLGDLRAAAPTDVTESPWRAFTRAMPLLVPDLEITKLETHADGRMATRGKSPMAGQGRYYFVLTMGGIGTGRADGTREVRLGVARYRDEADASLYDRPFMAWLEPQPGVVAVWLAGVLLVEDPYSSRRTP